MGRFRRPPPLSDHALDEPRPAAGSGHRGAGARTPVMGRARRRVRRFVRARRVVVSTKDTGAADFVLTTGGAMYAAPAGTDPPRTEGTTMTTIYDVLEAARREFPHLAGPSGDRGGAGAAA